jgi:tRNA1Val (adenine37-N6)-methyltransferase
VGTGTGLIALMLAQRIPDAFIDGVEINEEAVLQAIENVNSSPWKNRIRIYHSGFSTFAANCKEPYDLIVCNPPFFSKSLKPGSSGRTIARHDDQLSIEELFKIAVRILAPDGALTLILPDDKEENTSRLALSNDLFISQILRIRPLPDKKVKRILMQFLRKPGNLKESEICIEDSGRHMYSKEYHNLTREFYLDK